MTWEEIEMEIEKEEKELKELENQLLIGHVSFIHKNGQEGVYHPSTYKEYKYQFSYFDHKGAVGDFKRNSLQEVARGIKEYGFEACKENELSLIM